MMAWSVARGRARPARPASATCAMPGWCHASLPSSACMPAVRSVAPPPPASPPFPVGEGGRDQALVPRLEPCPTSGGEVGVSPTHLAPRSESGCCQRPWPGASLVRKLKKNTYMPAVMGAREGGQVSGTAVALSPGHSRRWWESTSATFRKGIY